MRAQEAAFEAQARLEAQVVAARSAVEQLQALADELDAAAGGLTEEMGAHATAAAAKQAKIHKYQEQQRTIAARLKAVGFCPEVCGPDEWLPVFLAKTFCGKEGGRWSFQDLLLLYACKALWYAAGS